LKPNQWSVSINHKKKIIPYKMDSINLVESFSEFKEFKNIDRERMMRILEDVFRSMLIKKYGSDQNFDIIVNIDKGDLEIWHNREIVEDGEVEDPATQIALV
jgi:transcription termination/antitermination protein NusA